MTALWLIQSLGLVGLGEFTVDLSDPYWLQRSDHNRALGNMLKLVKEALTERKMNSLPHSITTVSVARSFQLPTSGCERDSVGRMSVARLESGMIHSLAPGMVGGVQRGEFCFRCGRMG